MIYFEVTQVQIRPACPPDYGPCYGLEEEPPAARPSPRIPKLPIMPAAAAEKEPVPV